MSEGRSSVNVKGINIDDSVTLFVNNKVFNGWLDVSISRKINDIASSFSLSMVDKWRADQEPIDIKPGDKCHLHVGKKTVLDGYIDSVNLSVSGNRRTISVTGRSKTLDLVDCSHDGQSEYKETTMENIIEKILAPFNVAYHFAQPGGEIKKLTIRQGETVGEIIDRLCRQKKLIVYVSLAGTLIFNKVGNSKAASQIIQGVNLLEGSAVHDHSERFSVYKVKGQSSGILGTPKDATSPIGEATDKRIYRFRPMVIVPENSVNATDSKDRASFEANLRAAKSSTFNVTVQGFFDKDGNIWDINKIAGFRSDFLGYRGALLIDSIKFSKSSRGTVTQMTLVRKDAYAFKNIVEADSDPSSVLGGV